MRTPVFGFAGDNPVARFRKVQAAWKIDANAETGLKRPADFFKAGTWGPMFRDLLTVERQILVEIEKGQLRTAEATIAAFQKRLAALKDKYKEAGRKRRSRKGGPTDGAGIVPER